MAKTRKPVIPTDEYAKQFVKSRRNIPTHTLKGIQKADRDYLMSLFLMLKESFRGKVTNELQHTEKKFRYTPRQMYHNAMKYMKVTIEAGQPLTITAMGLFMGIRASQFFDMLRTRHLPPAYRFVYDCADFIESYNEWAAHRKQNPAGPIFILKNFGWRDKMEIEASAKKGALTEREREEAQKRLSQFSE